MLAWLRRWRDRHTIVLPSAYVPAERDWCNAPHLLGVYCRSWHVAHAYEGIGHYSYERYWREHWINRHGVELHGEQLTTREEPQWPTR